jgi:arginyl-tRNA synthetase
MTFIRNRLHEMLSEAIFPLLQSVTEGSAGPIPIELEIPNLAQHGDYATNVAFNLARQLKRSPREIATQVLKNLKDADQILQRSEIAGPGFLNFFIQPAAWHRVLFHILQNPTTCGRRNLGEGRRVQVEFVSANPTGPLHIGHGRGAATGDVLANILAACGYEVEREYYINDAGNQMDTLGRSLYYRYQELLGEEIEFPEGHYQGDYMRDLARELVKRSGSRYRMSPLDEVQPIFTRFAANHILEGIKDDLDVFGVRFDQWFSEQTLHDVKAIQQTIEALAARGFVYESEAARWFKSTAFGDEKDRVVIRSNGVSTYFASDLAYHREKFERGFDMVIDIWGADHHGYVERMLAGVQALGRKRDDLRIILVQLVNLLRAGKPVAMSTRAGEFVTLREVLDEVGRDAARFIFLTRRSDSQLDFDLEVAKSQSNDNPVYYVQYAHARLCSVFEVARERGVEYRRPDGGASSSLRSLTLPEELGLIKLLSEYPHVLAKCALALEPHFIPYYLHELVSLFHSYYNHNRILSEDAELTQARLAMADAVKIVIRNAMDLLGVNAPEKM